MHKRLKDDYTVDDFDLLGLILADFSDIVLLPHILAEVSNLARQIKNPARAKIQHKLKTLITTATELPIQSSFGAQRDEFHELGLTDAIILYLCNMSVHGVKPTLITADTNLANSAHSLGIVSSTTSKISNRIGFEATCKNQQICSEETAPILKRFWAA